LKAHDDRDRAGDPRHRALGSVRGVDGLLTFNKLLKSEVEVERLLDKLVMVKFEDGSKLELLDKFP